MVTLVEDEDKQALALATNTELNFVSPATLKFLRMKQVEFIPQMYW